MSEKRPSFTALITTIARAAVSSANGPANDSYAKEFLSAPWPIMSVLLQSPLKNSFWFRELLANVGGRTCFIDEKLSAALDDHVEQVVILGAGYDSRALRFKRDGVVFFEVDLPAIQENKRKILEKNNLSNDICFVSVDFSSDNLSSKLIQAGFQQNKKTFFVWEGVVEYLEKEVVQDTLKELKELSGDNSRLFCDPIAPKKQSLIHKIASQIVNCLGEPRKFEITPAELPELFAASGWQVKEVLTGSQLHTNYLKNFIKPPRFEHNYAVCAEVNKL